MSWWAYQFVCITHISCQNSLTDLSYFFFALMFASYKLCCIFNSFICGWSNDFRAFFTYFIHTFQPFIKLDIVPLPTEIVMTPSLSSQGRSGGLCAVGEGSAGQGVCPHLSHNAPAAAESQQQLAGRQSLKTATNGLSFPIAAEAPDIFA